MLLWVLTIAFVLTTLLVGRWGMKKTRNLNDFFLGGRTLNPWVAAFSYGTSYFSAVMFIGFAGALGWKHGIDVLWISLGNTLVGCTLAWFVLGFRTRRMTQNLNVMTMPEFFARRVGSPALKVLAALIIFVFLLPYSASVFQGLGHLFQITMGIEYWQALLFMCVITAIYMIMGGFHAMTFNDFLQGTIMLVGSALMFMILTGKCGGLMEAVSMMRENYSRHVNPAPPWYVVGSLVFVTSLGVWGLPQMVQKFYAIRDERQIFRGAIVSTCFSFVVVFAAYFMGGMTHIFYTNHPEQPATAKMDQHGIQPAVVYQTDVVGAPVLGRDGNPRIEYDQLVPDLMKSQLPEALMAVLVILVLSASMSTLSSLILVSSSTIAIDLYKSFFKVPEESKKPLVLIRILSGVFILVSLGIALGKLNVIVTLMSISWGAVAGAFMAPYLYALYWKRLNKWGVLAGMVTGIGISMTLLFLWGPARAPQAATIAMTVPFLVVPIVSWLTPKPDEELVALAFTKRVTE